MKARELFKLSRNWHRQVALLAALPLLITTVTGILLLMRGDFEWIQPKASVGSSQLVSPSVELDAVLRQLKTLPQAEVRSWKDVSSVNFNPAKGIYQARLKNDYEVQLDAATAKVLKLQFRTTNVLIELHQGSFFHPLVMKWVFLPSGLILLSLWLSGMYLFFYPKLQKRRKAASSLISQESSLIS